MISSALDKLSINIATKKFFLLYGLTLKLPFEKIVEILRPLSIAFGVSLERTPNID